MKTDIKCDVSELASKVSEKLKEITESGEIVFDLNIRLDEVSRECTMSLFHMKNEHVYQNKRTRSWNKRVNSDFQASWFRSDFGAGSYHNMSIMSIDIASNSEQIEAALQAIDKYEVARQSWGFFKRLFSNSPVVPEVNLNITVAFAIEAIIRKEPETIVVTEKKEEWEPMGLKHGF